MTRDEFKEAVINKVKRYDAQQYRNAILTGTKKAIKKYEADVMKFMEYRSKDIERWNAEHPECPATNPFETEEDRRDWFERN